MAGESSPAATKGGYKTRLQNAATKGVTPLALPWKCCIRAAACLAPSQTASPRPLACQPGTGLRGIARWLARITHSAQRVPRREPAPHLPPGIAAVLDRTETLFPLEVPGRCPPPRSCPGKLQAAPPGQKRLRSGCAHGVFERGWAHGLLERGCAHLSLKMNLHRRHRDTLHARHLLGCLQGWCG